MANLKLSEIRLQDTDIPDANYLHLPDIFLKRGGKLQKYQPLMGTIIAEFRSQLGFHSQDVLASEAGVDVRTVRKVEKGQKIEQAKLAAICHVLKTDVHALIAKVLERQNLEIQHKVLQDKGATRTAAWIPELLMRVKAIEQRVRTTVGPIADPTRATGISDFSADRLIASLSALGIPLDVALEILDGLESKFLDSNRPIGNVSTADIRSVVAQLISELNAGEIERTETFGFRMHSLGNSLPVNSQGTDHPDYVKTRNSLVDQIKFDWASRYARRYGNPYRMPQVIEENGNTINIDYEFIKGELLPRALKRLLGEDFSVEKNQLVNPSVISDMARTILEEFRRLNLYTIRYRTALWLVEDLAIHPPHPWVVTESTRDTTIAYDFERAEANLRGLKDSEDKFSVRHRFAEVIQHLCSAILGTYSGFLGHKLTASLHILRHWLSIRTDNPILWKRCQLHFIDNDLDEVGVSLQDFSALLKRIDFYLQSAHVMDQRQLVEFCTRLFETATKLFGMRKRMLVIDATIAEGKTIDRATWVAIVREVARSYFGARKPVLIKNKATGETVGFSASINLENTVLSSKQRLCLFIFAEEFRTNAHVLLFLDMVADQINAHRLADICALLLASEPDTALTKQIADREALLPSNKILRVLTLQSIRTAWDSSSNHAEFIDILFSHED